MVLAVGPRYSVAQNWPFFNYNIFTDIVTDWPSISFIRTKPVFNNLIIDEAGVLAYTSSSFESKNKHLKQDIDW